MGICLSARHRLRLAATAVAVLAPLIGVWSQPTAASAVTTPSSGIAHLITALPGCAVTYAPKARDNKRRVCLTTIAQLENMARKAGLSSGRAPVKPADAITNGCFFRYYQNGPYGSAAWANGWVACVNDVADNGYYWVPAWLNDQASAFDTCADVYFSVNQPGTAPASFAYADTTGNFPWGSVPNDSLSGALVYPQTFDPNCPY